MEIRLNKKAFNVAAIVFAIIALVGALVFGYLQYESWSVENGKYSVDKYGDVFNVCNLDGKFGKLEVSCTALLDRYEERVDGTECFYFSLITKGVELKQTTVCERNGVVKFDPNTMISEKKVLVYLNIGYERPLYGQYKFVGLDLKLVPDEKIGEIINNLSIRNADLPHVRTQQEEELINKGYYLSDMLEIMDGDGFQRFVIYTGEIKQVMKSEDNLKIKVNFNVSGNEYNTDLLSEEFFDIGEVGYKLDSVTVSNYEDLDLLGSKQIMLYYLDSNSKITNEDVATYCSSEDKSTEALPLCVALDGKDIDDYRIDDIEEYFKDMLSQSDDRNVRLDKLILGSLLFRL